MKEALLRKELLALIRGEVVSDSPVVRRKRNSAAEQNSAKRLHQFAPWHSASETDGQTATSESRPRNEDNSANVNLLTMKKKKRKTKANKDRGSSQTAAMHATTKSSASSLEGGRMTGEMVLTVGRKQPREPGSATVGAEQKRTKQDTRAALASTSTGGRTAEWEKPSSHDAYEWRMNISTMKKKKRKKMSAMPAVDQKHQDGLETVSIAPEKNVSVMKKKRRNKSMATQPADQKQQDEPEMAPTVLQQSVSTMKKKRRNKSWATEAVDQKQLDELEMVVEQSFSTIKNRRREVSVTPAEHRKQQVKPEMAPTIPEQIVSSMKKRKRRSSVAEIMEENQQEMHVCADLEKNMSALGADASEHTSATSKKKKRRKINAVSLLPATEIGEQNQDRPVASSETKIVPPAVTNKNCTAPFPVTKGEANDVAAMTLPAKGVMDGRLAGARFRDLNESLYAGLSREAFQQFSKEPKLFDQYHDGFRRQTDLWPESPLELISALLLRPAFAKAKVADLGCGEAKLAKLLGYERVDSFDLIEDKARRIRKCNINNSVPLPAESKDVVVLCLALMGQDCAGALREAWRILRPKGLLLVAEVTSRFESMECFAKQLFMLGFKLLHFKDFGPKPGNTHFFLLPFQKCGRQPDKTLVLDAKVCKYKRR